MRAQQFLEQLRQKSDIEKKTIAFVTALVVSGIILLMWMLTLPFKTNQIIERVQSSEELETFNQIKADVDTARDTIQNATSSIEEVIVQ